MFRHAVAPAVALGLMVSCSPEYRSGVTACGATAPRCPEGFTCVGIRCHRLGEEPKDAGTTPSGLGGGGSGGSSGAGGTSPGTGGNIGQSGGRGGTTAGTGGAAGMAGGGSGGGAPTPPDGGISPTPPIPPPPGAQAVGKFCNTLLVSGMSTTVDIFIGTVKLSAASSQCSSMLGMSCTPLPTGRVEVRMEHEGQILDSGPVTMMPGREYFFMSDLTDMRLPEFRAFELDPAEKCANATPDAVDP